MNPPILSDIRTRLSSISRSSALEASVLLGQIMGKPRTWVLAHPEIELNAKQNEELNDSLTRLERGEPFPYILGHWEFFGLDLKVTPDVLIPRPETELLVEKAVAWLDEHPGRRNIADVGTGSGAIAISLAFNVPDAKILATDISSNALQVAKLNAKMHDAGKNIKFVECDLLPEKSSVDLLCANLPYIPIEKLKKLPVFGREPTLALDGGPDGFKIIRRLMQIAPQHLNFNSLVLLEIEESHGNEAMEIARQNFPGAMIKLHMDLTGHDRLLEIQLP